jgi:branched-chain amino acid transport system substrate-binding protein
VQAMRDAFSKYASGFDYREGWTTAFWATGELFRKALSSTPAATSIDAATVVAAYNKVQNETLDGLLAQPVTFSNGKAKPVQCFWLYKYDVGDKDASSVAPVGASGNGQSGDLASSCFPPK